MAHARYTLYPRTRWTTYALRFAAVLALGMLLWGLFRAPGSPPAASPDAVWGVPARPVRVVCLDVGQWAGNFSDAAELFEGLRPDFVLAQRVPGAAVAPLAERLGMRRAFRPEHYVRIDTDVGTGVGTGGCLVLSKHPLYGATPLRSFDPDSPPHGVWASAIVDGRRFVVVSADAGPRLGRTDVPAMSAAAAMEAMHSAAGAPPLLAAFRTPNILASRETLLKTAGLTDAVGPFPADADPRALTTLIAFAGPWRASPADATRPHWVAPGITWAEVGGE